MRLTRQIVTLALLVIAASASAQVLPPTRKSPTAITVNTTAPLSGGGTGTTFTLSCAGCTGVWPLTNGISANTYTSAIANGAGNIGHIFDTTNTPGYAMSIRIGGVTYFKFDAGNMYVSNGVFDASGTVGELFTSNTIKFYNNPNIIPLVNNQANVGTVAARFTSHATYWSDTAMGAQLTAGATITPTAGIHHVTGGTTINIIAETNLPDNTGNWTITLISDGGITIGSSSSGGGIAVAPTIAVIGDKKSITLTHDGATHLWYGPN